jgi:hypothetical protein
MSALMRRLVGHWHVSCSVFKDVHARIEEHPMPAYQDPFNPNTAMTSGCHCGSHASQVAHDADPSRALRQSLDIEPSNLQWFAPVLADALRQRS